MSSRHELDAAVTRLVVEFAQQVTPGSVLRCFLRSAHELRAAGVDAGLMVAAEAMTRRRLEQRLETGAGAA